MPQGINAVFYQSSNAFLYLYEKRFGFHACANQNQLKSVILLKELFYESDNVAFSFTTYNYRHCGKHEVKGEEANYYSELGGTIAIFIDYKSIYVAFN